VFFKESITFVLTLRQFLLQRPFHFSLLFTTVNFAKESSIVCNIYAVCNCNDRPILVNVVRYGVPLSRDEMGHMMWGEVGLSQFTPHRILYFPQNVQLLYAVLI